MEKQIGVQALSPTGIHLNQELQARQVLLDRKLEAIEEDYYSRRPKHMRRA